jgi:O-acetyl-ADP-ribose deacetylase
MAERLIVVQGDITQQEVDAIVNAANQALRKGGGVDGAIHRAAGPELQEECLQVGGCPTGEARITKGYRLKAKYVIHAVGPRWQGGERGEAKLLASCYRNAIRLAAANKVTTIAFPSISTGVYGYPLEEATRIAIATIADALDGHPGIRQARFVTFGDEATAVAERVLAEIHRGDPGAPPPS